MPRTHMPKWKPAPPELTLLLARLLAAIPDAEPKKMFGYLAGFIRGNMFAGIFQDSIVLRLSEADRLAFVEQVGGTPFQPIPGRIMREYVVAPKALLRSSTALARWLEKAGRHAASLPPKAGKRRSVAKRKLPAG